jgi:hypothetical protein
MKDEFLSALQKEPSPEFAQSLRDHLERRPLRRRRFLWVGGAVALLAIAAAGAWQWTRPHYEQVGEIWVHVVPAPLSPQESARLHGATLPAGGEEPTDSPVGPVAPPSIEFLYLDPSLPLVGISEARSRFEERFGDRLEVPTWAPRGFSGGDRVAVLFGSLETMGNYAHAAVEWTNGEGDFIVLLVRSLMEWNLAEQLLGGTPALTESPAFVMFNVPPGGFEEVEVQGHAAVLLQEWWGLGGWYPDNLRNEVYEGLMLFWTEGSTFYFLQAPRELVTAADLIRMADSAE